MLLNLHSIVFHHRLPTAIAGASLCLVLACGSSGSGSDMDSGTGPDRDSGPLGDGGVVLPVPASYDCSENTETFANELRVGAGEQPSIRAALDLAVSEGYGEVKIVVEEGHDEGAVRGSLGVFVRALVVSETPYKSRITSIDLSGGDKAQNVSFEGFEIGNAPGIVIKMDGGRTTDQNIHHITFRHNIIHDSGQSDTVKINAGAHHITFERNVLYGHHDDTMDLNSVEHVYVHDNIFFDKDPGDRDFLVIKDSTPVGEPDFFRSTKHAYVRRNIFLNWQGGGNSAMIYLGEDNDRDEYAVQNALLENNLFIGNGNVGTGFAAPIAMRGVKDITVRNNTFAGEFQNGRSWSFLAWAISSPEVLRTEHLYVYNNAWVSAGVQTNRFSKSDADQIGDFRIENNLYWNGGQTIPQDGQGLINHLADSSAIRNDPGLPSVPSQISLPSWNSQTGQFDDGSSTICQAFERLVADYAVPTKPEAVAELGLSTMEMAAGDLSSMSELSDDIRGNARTASPGVGAVEPSP